jgi:N-ethylmaleimide reductase
MTDLFTPMDLNGLALPNRNWMSAMTRTRATADNIPTPLMGEYYGQRVTAGLIVTECTAVSEQGKGVINGPGLWTEDQVKGWREVTEAVHNAKGRIFCQLWHCGRVAHRDMRGGALPVSPSPLRPKVSSGFRIGKPIFRRRANLRHGRFRRSCQTSRRRWDVRARRASMVWSCMPRTVICMTSFCRRLAICASTPGAARPRTARLILETVDAMAAAWSIERVGVRLGPSISLGMGDNDPLLVRELDRRRIGCLTLLEPNEKDLERASQSSTSPKRSVP